MASEKVPVGSKLLFFRSGFDNFETRLFYCPGCKEYHTFDKRWVFNGDFISPTFTPSLLVNGSIPVLGKRCHCYVRNGKIEFLNDCEHELAGKTVDMEIERDIDAS